VSKPAAKTGERIIGLIVCAIFLALVWRASPAVEWFNQAVFIDQYWKRADTFILKAVAFFIDSSDWCLRIITIAAPLSVLISSKQESSGLAGLSLIVLAGLGWYVGKEYTKGNAVYQACMNDSFFGFGCSRDLPIFSLIFFAFLLFIMTAMMVLDIIAGFSENAEQAKPAS
jgi:hypothetical protein